VKSLLDEVFGPDNAVALITFQKTSSATSEMLAGTADYVIWYAKDREHAKFRSVWIEATADERTGIVGFASQTAAIEA